MSRLQQLGAALMRPLAWYNAAAKKNPATVGIVTTVLKTSAADIFAQKASVKQAQRWWCVRAFSSSAVLQEVRARGRGQLGRPRHAIRACVRLQVIERREDIDWKRNAVFTSFGFLYLGCWQCEQGGNRTGARAGPPVARFPS